ncbi:MAG: DUF1573 domain-containing protein [Bacteroidota bacterium]
MKTIKISVFALAALLMSFSPLPQTPHALQVSSVSKTASIKWKQVEIDLGEITQNQPVTVEFEFTNTGELPVVISGVQASCGCTSTNFSKTPVLPGETSKVSAIYNAAAKGSFKKTVTVTTNAEEAVKVLTLMGSVI